MTQPVDPDKIEDIVGTKRHSLWHYGRAVSAEQTFYILHSQKCVDVYGKRLDLCRYSMALDRGIDPETWEYFQDRPFMLGTLGPGHTLSPIVGP